MSVTPSPIAGFAGQFFDNNGIILSGGKIFTYAAGTTTPQASYTNASGITQHANPIVLDSAGRVPGGEIWLTDSLIYKFVIETSTNVLIGTYDNITGVNSNFVNYTVQEEVITATAGQTVFNLTTINYTPGTNSLSVYIDGVNQYVGDSYLETDSDTVTFTAGLHVGAEVKFTTAVQLTTNTIGAASVSYEPPFTGGVATNVEDKLAEYVSVKDFGAVGDGVTDDTAAFNLATMATTVHGGNNDLAMRRQIYVPAGDYRISGTVYVRKGQHLAGAGSGATRIISDNTNTGRITFHLGFGFIGGVPTQDPGGLPPVISDIGTLGGDASGGVIDMQVAGAIAYNLFLTSAGVAVRLGGGDTILSNCIIDQGLNGLTISGQNHIIDGCLFYNMNYGVTVNSNTFDVQIDNCHFEYTIFDDVLFATGSTNIQNVVVQNCQFLKNTQYTTSDYAIHIRSTGADIFVHGCEFRNQRGYSIGIPTGVGNTLRVSNCIFDGNRTNPVYDQSTTAAGVFAQNGNVEITNCQFENLFGYAVEVNSTLNYPTTIKSCSYRNISTVTHAINITATTGDLQIADCVGDGVAPLINLQSAIRPRLKGNKQWLGQVATSGGRYYWELPTTGAAILTVGIVANPLPGGNLNYRKASYVYAARDIDFNGSIITDYAYESVAYETPAQLLSPLDVQVDLDSVGGGSSDPYVAQGRYIVVSVPSTYTDVEIEADYTV